MNGSPLENSVKRERLDTEEIGDSSSDPEDPGDLDTSIRNLRQYESLNHLNTHLRKAKDLDDGYRRTVTCIDPHRFSTVILLIAEEDAMNEETSSKGGKRDGPGTGQGAVQYLHPKYVWSRGEVSSLEELLHSKERDDLLSRMSFRVGGSQYPLDKVMRGNEQVLVRDTLPEDGSEMCRILFRLLDMTGEITMFSILTKMDRNNCPGELGHYGVIIAEKTDEIMDEEDWDYLRKYATIVGLALENIHLLENLTRTIGELEEEKNFRDNIILMMSHEINTPLTSIKLMNECIMETVKHLQKDHENDELMSEGLLLDILDSARHIIVNSSRLETLSKKLHNSLLVQQGKFEIEKQNVHIDTLVEELLDVMKHFIHRNHATIRNHLPERGLPVIVTDPEALQAALEIIIENAVHYMPKDLPPDTQHHPLIDIDGRTEDSDLIISVQDNGRGFGEREMKRIFNRLYRVTTIRHHRERPGLGLPTAKDIIELLGGEIRPHSDPGKGSIFEVALPLK